MVITIDLVSGTVELVKEIILFIDNKMEKNRRQKKEIFEKLFEEKFINLEKIHLDYLTNLKTLYFKLKEKKLPPIELLKWLNEVSLVYSTSRGKLKTNDFLDIIPKTKKNEPFFNLGKEYLTAVTEYFYCPDVTDVSFYGRFEGALNRLINSIEKTSDNDKIFKLFYESDYVEDMMERLYDIYTKCLPKYWINICNLYEKLNAKILTIN